MQVTALHLNRSCNRLEVSFGEQVAYFAAEYLRVYSPSAEVTNHGGRKRWPLQAEAVQLQRLELVGRYAVKLTFSDGHASGLYTWEYLQLLQQEYATRWQAYQAVKNQIEWQA